MDIMGGPVLPVLRVAFAAVLPEAVVTLPLITIGHRGAGVVVIANILTGGPADFDNGAHMFREMLLDHRIVIGLELMHPRDAAKIQKIVRGYMSGGKRDK